jgi:hypothetical protein
MKALRLLCLFVSGASALAFAQSNPVPFVNHPLVPMTVVPGSPGFTLAANGTGFVSAAVVNWNGVPLTTTFVSSSQLTATVPAANVAKPGTASVTVTNPAPGGGASNVVYGGQYAGGASFVGRTTAADFNRDGLLDLFIVYCFFNGTIGGTGWSGLVLPGNADGLFGVPHSLYWGPTDIQDLGEFVIADFNGDGKPDLVFQAGTSTLLNDVSKSSVVLDREVEQEKRHDPSGPRFRCFPVKVVH